MGTWGRGWKVPDGCAGRRRRLCRCVVVRYQRMFHIGDASATAPDFRGDVDRREGYSLRGSLNHRKCSTTLRDGSVDPRPAFVVGSSPVVTTVESVNGALVLSRRSSDCSDSPARSRPGESEQGAMAQGGTMARGSDMTLCSRASPEEAKRMRRMSGARTWQGPFPRACRFLSGNLP